MSPHFASSPSPAQGPHSPLMQMSPQTNNWSQPVRPTAMATNSQQVMQQSSQNVSIQQTNPMLNAQLSGTHLNISFYFIYSKFIFHFNNKSCFQS
jgi:hypothetical protein